MNGLETLSAELDAWISAGEKAKIWWRDDDASYPSNKLDKLIETANCLNLAPLLALIPARTSPNLQEQLSKFENCIAIHGFNHINHEAKSNKKSEFGSARPISIRLRDLMEGKKQLTQCFANHLINCFVPPWNRIGADFVKVLPKLGISVLSTFGPRAAPSPVPGLLQVNTHIDIINWHKDRAFIGAEAMAFKLAKSLNKARSDIMDCREPTGILSHHLEMTERDWREFTSIFALLKHHQGATILHPHSFLSEDKIK